MSEKHRHCAATTKAGTHCKNSAMHGSDYCNVHQSWAQETTEKGVATDVETEFATPVVEKVTIDPEETIGTESESVQSVAIENDPVESTGGNATTPSPVQASFEVLAAQLNELASELQKSIPNYIPPTFTPDGLVALVKGNLEKFTPDMQVEILSELRRNLEGTTAKDLIDPDTWKGFWYILNYTAQTQSTAALENVWDKVMALPGMALLSDLKGNLAGTSPKEFLDPDTWKGMWLVMNYSLQATAADLKRKLDGDNEADE